jgi:hypothetical protein
VLRIFGLLLCALILHAECAIQAVDHVVLRTADGSREFENLVFYPDGTAPCQVVVFSHDLGRSRSAYWYLGEAWAKAGLVVVFPTHATSDREAFARIGLFEAAATAVRSANDPAVWRARAADLAAVAAGLATIEAQAPALRGRLSRANLGIAGHGFGALSAAAAGGLVPLLAGERIPALAVPAYRAGLLLGPPGCWTVADREAWGQVAIPLLVGSGDHDRDLAAACGVADERGWQLGIVAYLSPPAEVLHLPSAHHWTWSNGGWGPRVEPDHITAITATTTAFWQRAWTTPVGAAQPRLSVAP